MCKYTKDLHDSRSIVYYSLSLSSLSGQKLLMLLASKGDPHHRPRAGVGDRVCRGLPCLYRSSHNAAERPP
jgi:hypothetical protein